MMTFGSPHFKKNKEEQAFQKSDLRKKIYMFDFA